MPAPARPYWTGFLKLSLVTIGVRLYTATTERERVRFHQIHEPSGERVRQQLVVPGIGPVERDDIVKGYEYEKGRYVTVDPDDIKRLKLDTTDTIDIVEFVEQIDPIYFDQPYYLVPDGNVAEEGYRVIREALAKSGKVAVGRLVINGQERTLAIRPLGTGLLGNAVHYADEVRQPADYFAGIAADAVDDEQLAIMDQIIQRKTRVFDPAEFADRYQVALRDLVAEKLAGKLPAPEPERRPAQVINLMDALKRSLAEADGAPAPRRAAKTPAALTEALGEAMTTVPHQGRTVKEPSRGKKTAAPVAQRSLLLPVTGGAGKSADRAADAEPVAASASAKRRKRA
ncbi:MAG TPA: Ku protein [Stellaceae bacterium]|nr:Ku protein [Stellaceae bacterium]